jgi:hypothetical protein
MVGDHHAAGVCVHGMMHIAVIEVITVQEDGFEVVKDSNTATPQGIYCLRIYRPHETTTNDLLRPCIHPLSLIQAGCFAETLRQSN